MRSKNCMKQSLKKWLHISANPQTRDRIWREVLIAQEQCGKNKPALMTLSIWRIMMKSPVTKLAALAVIIIACVISLSLWRTTSSGIALADVLTRIEQATDYSYQMRSTIKGQKTNTVLISNVLISQENGVKIITKRINRNNDDINSADTYLLPKLNAVIFVVHENKMFVRLKFDGMKLEYYKEEHNDPRIIIRQILSCEHTSLGQSVIDGITVEGFQTTDSAYEGGFMGQADFEGKPDKVDVKLWVDVNTFLPVRLEEDIVTTRGAHMHEVSYDFQWNVTMNADDFTPVIPQGYKSTGEIVVPAFKEENAIKGLRQFANLAGEYPDDLDAVSLNKKARKLIGFDIDSLEDLGDDEKTKFTSQLMSIMGPAFFYEKLVDDKKEPVYYGHTVGPDDTNKVLMRWKLDNIQYRVIFGDLSIKNVTSQELAELEK